MSAVNRASDRTSRWRGKFAAIVVFALALGAVSLPGAAMADPLPSVAGTVTGNGGPIEGATVSVVPAADENDEILSVVTGADGTYELDGLADGNYKLHITASGWVEEWYDNVGNFASASIVEVVSTSTNPADVVLESATDCLDGSHDGHIFGTVLTDADGEALSGATVKVRESGVLRETQTTGVDGAFSFECLNTNDGYYTVTVSSANLVSHTDAVSLYNYGDDYKTWDLGNIRLISGWTVSGTVTGKVLGSVVPLGGITVTAIDDHALEGDGVSTTTTASDGSFSFTHVASSEMYVRFTGQSGLATEWWNNAPSQETATALNVDHDLILNAQLDPATTISGTVTGKATTLATALPLEDIDVDLYTAAGKAVATTSTAADGTYSFTGLMPGSYKLRFAGEPGSSPWLPTWYFGKTTLGAANAITLNGVSPATGRNAVLAHGASIAGHVAVLGGGGVGIANIEVTVRKLDGTEVGSANTDSGGDYAVQGLTPGTYTVQFHSNGSFAGEWWDNGLSEASSTAVVLAAGAAVTGISADLPFHALIQGEITTPYGDEPYVDAYLYTKAGELVAKDLDTNFYTFYDVQPGDYVIKFVSPDHQFYDEYWKDKYSRLNATTITVGEADDVENDDAVISRRLVGTSQLHGRVTDSLGAPIEDASVTLFDASNNEVDYTYTDADGDWSIEDLMAGKYTFYVDASWPDGFTPEYWKDKASFRTANLITLGATQSLEGLNMSLAKGGTIGGDIEGSTYGQVDVFRTSDGALVYSDNYSYGEYDTDLLAPGSYRLRFTPEVDESSAYGVTWSGGARGFATATSVVVTAENETTSNVALATGWSTLRGKTVTSTGVPIAGVDVDIFSRDPDGVYRDLERTVETDGTGIYTFTHLPAGAYKLRFTDQSGAYKTEWYREQSTAALAPAIAIGSLNATVTAYNDVLNPVAPKLGLTTPKVTGTVAVGMTLTGSVQAVSPSSGVYRYYQWQRNGVNISGATLIKYKLTSADVGKDITLRVTVVRAGYTSAAKTSVPVNTLTPTS